MEKIKQISNNELAMIRASDIPVLSEQELIRGDSGYRRGFTHGVQTVIDLLANRMERHTLDAAEQIQEIAMRYRFDRKTHLAFGDDIIREWKRSRTVKGRRSGGGGTAAGAAGKDDRTSPQGGAVQSLGA
jgi:hypothetical protein